MLTTLFSSTELVSVITVLTMLRYASMVLSCSLFNLIRILHLNIGRENSKSFTVRFSETDFPQQTENDFIIAMIIEFSESIRNNKVGDKKKKKESGKKILKGY